MSSFDLDAAALSQLMDMGFSSEQAYGALRRFENNLERAADYLFSDPSPPSAAPLPNLRAVVAPPAPNGGDNIDIPEHFVCTITCELMADPVVTCDGHTYERSAIEYWLQSNNTSPITNEPLSSKALIPNFLLRSQIAAFKDANPQSAFAGGSSSPPPPAPISAWSAAGAPVVSSTVVATPSPPAPLPAGAGHALLKEEMNKKKNKTIRMYTGDNGGAAEEEISPSERSSSLVSTTRSFPGGSSTHISAPASEPKPLERSKSSQDAQKALERALASKGLAKFSGALWNYGVRSIDALLDLEPVDCDELGLTPFQLRTIRNLANEKGSGGGNDGGNGGGNGGGSDLGLYSNGGAGDDHGAVLSGAGDGNDLDKKTKKHEGTPKANTKFASTHVVIDGRGCLVGKGDKGFSAAAFSASLNHLLLAAGAQAKMTKIVCVAIFEPLNEFHPCTAVTEALRVDPGIDFIVPMNKPGADDVLIKDKLRKLAIEFCDEPSKACVVLVANDKDFAPEIRELSLMGIRTVLLHRAKNTSQAFIGLFDAAFGSWDDVLLASGLGEPQAGKGKGKGACRLGLKCMNPSCTFKHPPGRVLTQRGQGNTEQAHAADFVAAVAVLGDGGDPPAFSVDDLVLKVSDRVQAKYKATSHTWKDATVVRILPGKDPQLLFDDFDDAVPIPKERIKKQAMPLALVTSPASPQLPELHIVEVVQTSFEKGRWLLKFEATRKKLASAKFDGVSVEAKGRDLKICIRDRDNDEQMQAAAELGAALKQAAAGLKVSRPFFLVGAVIGNLWSDLELKRLEREERVLVLRPKELSQELTGAASAAADSAAVSIAAAPADAPEVRLVSAEASDLARVRAHLSETHTLAERELPLSENVARLSYEWIERQILLPAEARHQVKISLDRGYGAFVLVAGKGSSGGKGKGGKGGGGGKGGRGSGGGVSIRIRGVPWRVGHAFAAIEATVQATQVKFLKITTPEPELVAELRKLRKNLLRKGDEEGDGDSSENGNSNSSGMLLVTVYAPLETTGCPPPFVKVTLATTSVSEAHGCANPNCDFLRHSVPPPVHFTFEDVLFCCSKCRLSSEGGSASKHGGECERQVCGAGSADSDYGGGKVNTAATKALEAAHKSFLTLRDTFGTTMFRISDTFSKPVDAAAASDALQERLAGPRQASDFAANFGLVKVAWDYKNGVVKLTGDERARKMGCSALAEIGRGAKIETVWLSWPDEHLFRSLFGFDAANGAVALARLHAAIKSAELPTGATVDLGAGLNPANYAAVRGASALVEAGAKAVRAAVEAFVREHVVVEPVRGLAPAEEAFLAAPPRALAAGIEATHSVVVDFNGDGDCTLAKGTQVEVFGVVSKPELNGRRGEVVSFGVSKDRLHVQLSAAPGHPREKPLALRASALRILSGPGGSSGRTPRVLLEATGEGTGAKVRVLHGDLLFSGCCAIINAANGRLAHGGGVASAIAFAAGPACESECRQLVGAAKGGRLPTGAAVPTSAGAVLGARGTKVVVHAVVPEWDLREGGDASVLLMQQAVRAALAEAEKAGARSVAIPLCGSGIFGWPASRAAEAVVGALVAYAANPATKLQCLDLVDFDAPKAAASAAALSDLCGAAPKAADATSAVPLPNNQWFFYCKELSKRKDGFQPYDYDQNQQIEAAWAAFVDNSILNEVTIIGDAGGVRSNSTNIPEGKTAAEYLICFKPRIEDCRQKNVVSVFERQLKREKCIEPPPLFEARVAEAAQVGGGSGGSVRSGGGLFRITRDGRGSSGGGGCGAVAARASVAVRGFAENAQAGARALIEAVRASKREKELRVDDAETPSQDLLVDLQAAAADFCATVELAPDGKRAVVRAFGDALLAAAFGVCVDVREQAREAARAPPAGWDLAVRTAAGTSFVLTAVPQGSAEWCRVADAIAVTLPAAKLTRLERVQNKAKWDEYAQRRAEVTKSSPDGFDANEVMCFHGTRGFPVVKVCEAGLDFRHGNAGCMWGIALYIAANASYSDAYSSDGNNGERQFFYVRAALGRPSEMLPNASTRAPPPGFDSVRGTTGGSRVHMLYDLGQAYPEYLVTYRRG